MTNTTLKENIMEEITVTISEEEYQQLLEDSRLLACLQNAGVDNWEWYDDALEEMVWNND